MLESPCLPSLSDCPSVCLVFKVRHIRNCHYCYYLKKSCCFFVSCFFVSVFVSHLIVHHLTVV